MHGKAKFDNLDQILYGKCTAIILHYRAKMKFKLSRRMFAILVILAAAGGAAAWNALRNEGAAYQTVRAARTTVVQEVSVTGRTEPVEDAELGFENSGRVSRVAAFVGERVVKGTLLVELDAKELSADLREAEASVETERAKLQELLRGTRIEEIRVQEAKVGETGIARENAEIAVRDAIREAFIQADDAIRNKVDQFFTDPQRANPQLTFELPNATLKKAIETERAALEHTLRAWNTTLLEISAPPARNNLNQVQSFLSNVAEGLSVVAPAGSITQANIDKYRADVAAARVNVSGATNNLSTAEEKFRNAETSLTVQERELALARAGAAQEEIDAQAAQLRQAEARVQVTQAQIAKRILRSPITGVVTVQNGKLGEIIAANTPIVSVISDEAFEIEANISEADIVKVKLGDPAALTLDAYGADVVFKASVSAIDPAETVIEGVTTYKTTLQFDATNVPIRSNMTANIDILTAEKRDALSIPQRAIFTKNGGKFVRVVKGTGLQEVRVETGLLGSDGTVEITSGLREGEEVVTFIET
ncbi:MAG: efflux RND transporter periplasmic adaptor subunit [Candidatus Liptonbacteria bacterium]|nr:efflux RND transporter periplasmic adaptor subunit [Candidatus Liptonbacteria bacterium]